MTTTTGPTAALLTDYYKWTVERATQMGIKYGFSSAEARAVDLDAAEAGEDALSAVFEEAKPLHGLLNVGWLKYDTFDNGQHVALFANERDVYRAFFSRGMTLEYIEDAKNDSFVWCADD